MSNVSPFIKPINIQGGSFYTMSSASEDLAFTFNNDGKQFKFSKYALLNIPDIKRPIYPTPNQENVVQLDVIPGAFAQVTNDKSQNMLLAESFQNYALNLETMCTQYPTYDVSTLQNVSERVFFKWLKEIGALRFREASTIESPLTAGLRFTEEVESDYYTRVVKYIGEIDVVNSVKNAADAYSEIYVHVPTKDGATPLVLFKSVNDKSYFPGQNLINAPKDPLNTEFIVGRTPESVNPAGLNTYAYFDSDTGTYGASAGLEVADVPYPTSTGYTLFKYNENIGIYSVGWWFTYPEANSYWTEPEAITGSFDDPGNDCYLLKGRREDDTIAEISYKRSRLDGIQLDFKIENYYPIASNSAINSFSDFNGLAETTSFDFNAVLVYYDITDVSTGETATNLFGILFLDNVEDSAGGGGSIPRLSKYKPNRITGLNGNSFGFKINLKFDINSEQTAIVSAVNEYAPFSMQLFVEALNELQSSADTLTGQNDVVEQLITEVKELQGLVYDSDDIQEIQSRLKVLEDQIVAAGAIFENSSDVLELIQRNYNEILNIYQNNTSVTVAYNTDVIQHGDGILVDKNTPNQVIIKNTRQGYTIDRSPIYNILTTFTSTPSAWTKEISLSKYGNYMKLSNGEPVTVDRDIKIYINDSEIKWSNGQTFKIVIDHNYPIDMSSNGSFDIMIYTDALDTLNTGETYSKLVGRISSNQMSTRNGIAQLEIICIDKDMYTFTYDLI